MCGMQLERTANQVSVLGTAVSQMRKLRAENEELRVALRAAMAGQGGADPMHGAGAQKAAAQDLGFGGGTSQPEIAVGEWPASSPSTVAEEENTNNDMAAVPLAEPIAAAAAGGSAGVGGAAAVAVAGAPQAAARRTGLAGTAFLRTITSKIEQFSLTEDPRMDIKAAAAASPVGPVAKKDVEWGSGRVVVDEEVKQLRVAELLNLLRREPQLEGR